MGELFILQLIVSKGTLSGSFPASLSLPKAGCFIGGTNFFCCQHSGSSINTL